MSYAAISRTASSALDLIGGTPLVELGRVRDGPGKIFAKAEFLQPGGSVKDRAALAILLAARSDGRLPAGAPVVEMTSGNMGSGLAVACAVLGHPLTLTMSAGNSPQRAAMVQALGAELVLVPQVDGTPGRVTGADIEVAALRAREIAQEVGGFYVDQFNALEGFETHRLGTGPEILNQLIGRIDAWVCGVGTGATFFGVAAALRSRNPDIRCIAVEPAGCEPLSGKPLAGIRHRLQGIGYGIVPPHARPDLFDGTIAVADEEAARWKELLATREGLHVGYSSAANVCAAAMLLDSEMLPRDANVVTVLCDTGLKY